MLYAMDIEELDVFRSIDWPAQSWLICVRILRTDQDHVTHLVQHVDVDTGLPTEGSKTFEQTFRSTEPVEIL